ncbi:MAG: AAA family ATPase [Deltaproteobacteria bacterium]|nr:AAA family ATPase [Deltaproteobacteria bacterium]
MLITGPPGIGKTTLIKHLSEALGSFSSIGFYTAEIKRREDIHLGGKLGRKDL